MAADALPRARRSQIGWLRDLILPLGIVASVLVILVPMPAAIMDLLLAANITIAVIMLLTTIYVRTPLEFSIFPSLLLATTLARLVLNVATTRLILTRTPTDGMLAAGSVIKSFGEFVAGDKLVVGLILFAIIVVIQFVVITKGATRISEVAARFALDGMPGRQMAIDADVNAGLIDHAEAQRRRGKLTEQADFFGAMDGASKFIRGDAIAGIIIILVNIVGGLFIGVVQSGMGLSDATGLFTRLTIGDGLVSQVPAFLISLAAGLLVTRSTAEVNLPSQFISQLFSRPETLAITGGLLGMLLFTGLPVVPLLAVGGGCIALSLMLGRQQRETAASAAAAAAPAPERKPATQQRVEDYLSVDPMEIEIGAGLIRLADPLRDGDLLERIQRVRQSLAAEIGILMPKVRVRDNLRLDQNAYRIKIADVVIASGVLHPAMLLAIDIAGTARSLRGLAARDPASDRPATWIDPQERGLAEGQGYEVLECGAALAAHLTEVVRQHADEILSRDATKHLLDELKKTSPAVVEELIPHQMKLADVQQVLQMLLREQVPIRQLGAILETLGEHASPGTDLTTLAECVRTRLARTLCTRYRDEDNRVLVLTLDAEFEERIRAGLEKTPRGIVVRLSPHLVDSACRMIEREIERTQADLLAIGGRMPILLVSPDIRAGLKQLTTARLPRLVVLSYDEITRDTRIEALGMVGATEETLTRV